ncbi:MAG: hypothetical protein ACFBSC_15045 [Microcoleaceae cyanobacterium]
MLSASLIYLLISGLAAGLTVVIPDEVFQVMSCGVAMLCFLLSLVSAPWLVLLVLVAALMASQFGGRLQKNSQSF